VKIVGLAKENSHRALLDRIVLSGGGAMLKCSGKVIN
jgi:hypothetical protein